ncbi:MAG: GrpB family protein [Ruminococcaceae bacterium]|nr:GrpB family protein [Oscillospiraceae bacterium]
MMLGLQRGTVKLEPHSPQWETAAQDIIIKLKDILENDIVDAQHIGSTAIKCTSAKPIIDIVAGVESFDRIFKYNDILSANGIIYRRQDHPNQHLYICGDLKNNIHTHYIHVVLWGGKEWTDYINMRDYLNAHKEKAIEYSNIKKYLAEKYPDDRTAYTNGKSDFITEILHSAAEWKKASEAIKKSE